ncbi:GntR family transcriptional regulator [Devosia sp.]|uniref:GntR family transcriptional regulator n=1 Tax=Devosia sp. TaxID=1871048 RepID=UPI001B01B704|nr:GntR family transcriptional regulator [Devosia sp.]MBO9590907.1 GntR family transcriptional regulator [Devosia sp.]
MAFARRNAREPAADQAYAVIRSRILELTYAPHELLSENGLATEFETSRTPVREALKRLEGEGLVEVRPQQGTFVSPIRRELVMDAQYARSALECALVADAARLRSDEDLHALEFNLAAQIRAAERQDFDLLFKLDEDMHKQIAAAARRTAVWDVIADIKIHMDRARKLSLKPYHVPTLIEQHQAIIQAIATGREDDAVAAMRDHLGFVVEHFDELVER